MTEHTTAPHTKIPTAEHTNIPVHVGFGKKIMNFIQDHKVISFLIAAAVCAGGYYGYSAIKTTSTPVRYGVAQVQNGTLVVSVSGSGQVLASSQISINPKVSGTVTNVLVKQGDKVKEGQPMVQLDAKDANKAVRDAQLNLQTANVALKKLDEAPDNLSLVQAKNSLSSAQNALTLLTAPPDASTMSQAQNDVASAQIALEQAQTSSTQQSVSDTQQMQSDLDGAYNSISDTFINVPGYITDIESVVTNTNNPAEPNNNVNAYELILGNSSTLITSFLNNYQTTISEYNTIFDEYKSTPRSSDHDSLVKLIVDALTMENQVDQELEGARNIFNSIITYTNGLQSQTYAIVPFINTLLPKIDADISGLNSSITQLQTAKNNLDTITENMPIDAQKSQDSISSAKQNLTVKQEALAQLIAGAKSEDIENAQNNVTQAQASLDKLQQGPDILDVQNQKLTIQQRQNALQDAKDNLANYTVTAPFDGVVASVAAVNGGTALNGQSTSSSTSVATIITTSLLAQVSLNEVDAAKVALGDKATLTFDALPNVSIAGQLVQIDTIGVSTQGVVSYNAEVAFDTASTGVKPGMSVTAAIVTAVDQNVLLIPNAALKTQGTVSYVQVFDSSLVTPDTASSSSTDLTTTTSGSTAGTGTVISLAQPQRKFVQAGDSNDTSTAITSGLSAGDWVVTQTYSAAAAAAAATATASSRTSSSIRIPGLGGGGGPPGG
jgi:multidrug efflux pump subunit AcrA (membrane-fusion protein)